MRCKKVQQQQLSREERRTKPTSRFIRVQAPNTTGTGVALTTSLKRAWSSQHVFVHFSYTAHCQDHEGCGVCVCAKEVFSSHTTWRKLLFHIKEQCNPHVYTTPRHYTYDKSKWVVSQDECKNDRKDKSFNCDWKVNQELISLFSCWHICWML